MTHASDHRGAYRPVFLYDGDCAFCTSCARFIERHVPTSADLTPWQFADLEALAVSQPDAEASVQWIDPRSNRGVPPRFVRGIGRSGSESGDQNTEGAAGAAAIARLLMDAGSCWRPLGWLLDLRAIRWIAGPVYRLIARNRHRLPGGTAACRLPHAERDRIDSR